MRRLSRSLNRWARGVAAAGSFGVGDGDVGVGCDAVARSGLRRNGRRGHVVTRFQNLKQTRVQLPYIPNDIRIGFPVRQTYFRPDPSAGVR